MEFEQIAIAATTLLAPYMPFLIELGKEGGKKLAETIAEEGGKAAWQRAEVVWAKIKEPANRDPKLNGALTLVSAKPDDQTYLRILSSALTDRMKNDPELAKALLVILGGEESVQNIVITSGSWARNITQETTGGGSQRIEVRDGSAAQDIHQKRS